MSLITIVTKTVALGRMNTDKRARGFVKVICEPKLDVRTTMKHILGLLFCLVCVNVVQSWLSSDDPCYLSPRYKSG